MASLRDLGLSEYEDRTYRALLQTGPTTAKHLSQVSDVPKGRIYDVLSSLEQYELVRSQTASRPKKYVALEADIALERLLETRRRELEEQEQRYEAVVDELTGALTSRDPGEETFWTAAVGVEETRDLLIERLAAAEERLAMVASTPGPRFDVAEVGELVADELADALDKGVSIRLLLVPELVEHLPASVGERDRETLATHENFAVRTTPAATGSFHLVDDGEVCIEVPHPLEEAASFAMIDLKDRAFANRVRQEFEPRWQDADTLTL